MTEDDDTPTVREGHGTPFVFPDWAPLPGYEQAVCANLPKFTRPDGVQYGPWDVDRVFFPDGNGPINEAKMLCYYCPLGRNGGEAGPLVGSCLNYALEMEETPASDFGVWGGTVPGERAAIRRGELDPDDLYGECRECGDPMPVRSAQKVFCSAVCGERARGKRSKVA